VDGALIFPHPEGALRDRYDGFADHVTAYPAHVREHAVERFTDIAHLADGLHGVGARAIRILREDA